MLDQTVALMKHRTTVPTLAEAVVLNPKHRFQLCCVVHAPAFWDPACEVLPNGGLLSWFTRALQGHSLPEVDMVLSTSTLRQDNFSDFPGLVSLRPLHCTAVQDARQIVHSGRLIPGGPSRKRNDVHFGCHLPRERFASSPGAHVTKPIWIFVSLRQALENGAISGTTLNGVLLSRQDVPLTWCSVVNIATGTYFPSNNALQGMDLITYRREGARLTGNPVTGPINAIDESITFEPSPVSTRRFEGTDQETAERKMSTFIKHGSKIMSTDLLHLHKYYAEVEKQRLSHSEIQSIWESLLSAPPGLPARYEDFRCTDASVREESPTVRVAQSSTSMSASVSEEETRAQRARANEEARKRATSESSCCICLGALLGTKLIGSALDVILLSPIGHVGEGKMRHSKGSVRCVDDHHPAGPLIMQLLVQRSIAGPLKKLRLC